MKISDLPEATSYDSESTIPIDIDGATYQISVDKLTPDIVNDIDTIDEGYVLDARQGKALSDAIAENEADIADMQSNVQTGIVVDVGAWTLYDSRSTNSGNIYYPRQAKEVLIHVYTGGFHYVSAFIPGVLTSNFWLNLGGGYSKNNSSSSAVYRYYEVYIIYETRAVQTIQGSDNGSSVASNTVTEVWYR